MTGTGKRKKKTGSQASSHRRDGMKAVNMVIAILIAFAAAAVVLYMSSIRAEELQKKVELLETNLEQTRGELKAAQDELAKADNSKLEDKIDDLAGLWDKVDDLSKKDIELKAEIDKLAAIERTAPPVVAGGPDDEPESEEKEMQRTMRGLAKMAEGFGQRMLERQMGNFKKQLNLNETQAEDMQKLLSDTMKKGMEEMRKAFEGGGEGLDPQALREKFETEFNDELKKILTQEQFEKFQELSRGMMGRMGGMGGFGPRGGRGGGQDNPLPDSDR
jgi:outer membrane murein-binding lipoprotein Lpp